MIFLKLDIFTDIAKGSIHLIVKTSNLKILDWKSKTQVQHIPNLTNFEM